MKLYTVTVNFDFVVVADNEKDAEKVAKQEASDAFRDLDKHDLDLYVFPGVDATGWDDDCIPYGGDGNTRTRDYKLGEKQ